MDARIPNVHRNNIICASADCTKPASSPSDPCLNLLLSKRFILKKFICEGSFGKIYLGSDTSTPKTNEIIIKTTDNHAMNKKEY